MNNYLKYKYILSEEYRLNVMLDRWSVQYFDRFTQQQIFQTGMIGSFWSQDIHVTSSIYPCKKIKK